MSEHTILVATTNPGKVAELRQLLHEGIKWLGLTEVGPIPQVVEDGLTLTENARKKAVEYAQTTGYWTLSDDSGLLVDALDGAPGVHSARFSGISSQDRSVVDRANINKVLNLMQDTPDTQRTARFACCLCLASPQGILLETEGTLEGKILKKCEGDHGFGYDPIFFVPSLNKTTAQLSTTEKNAISHRGNAIRALKPRLQNLLQTTVNT